jgi:hypothetical protein
VDVVRGEDGRIRLGLEASSERGAELVRTRAEELRGALEARGVSLQEFTVEGPDGRPFALDPTPAAEGSEAAHRRASEAGAPAEASRREDTGRETSDERQHRRGRPQPEGEEDE